MKILIVICLGKCGQSQLLPLEHIQTEVRNSVVRVRAECISTSNYSYLHREYGQALTSRMRVLDAEYSRWSKQTHCMTWIYMKFSFACI